MVRVIVFLLSGLYTVLDSIIILPTISTFLFKLLNLSLFPFIEIACNNSSLVIVSEFSVISLTLNDNKFTMTPVDSNVISSPSAIVVFDADIVYSSGVTLP